MEQFLLLMLRHIAEQLPELSLIDEDTGQLETGEDTYPVTFPCVLVGNIETDWNDLGYSGAQQGNGTVVVRLAIDCYDDTHIGSMQEEAIINRQQTASKLYRSLQCEQFTDNIGPLVRVKSRDYTLPGCIKIYEQMYTFEVQDNSAMDRNQ